MATSLGLREPLPEPAPPPFGPRSFDELFDQGLHTYPKRLALIDGERTWTWAQLHSEVTAVADSLRRAEAHLGPQGNSAETIIGILAILHNDGIWVGKAPDDWPLPPHHFWADPDADSIDGGRGFPAAISFTSGSTGSPKAVVHSNHSLLLPGLVSVEVEPPQAAERIGTPLDLSIANVFVLGPLSALLRGATFVVMKRRYAAGLAEDIEAGSITRLIAVPTMAYDLVHDETIGSQQLGSLERVIVGGSGCDPVILEMFTERFGVRPTLSYGLSEAPTGVVRESLDDPIGSGRGFSLPHIEVAILDPASGDKVKPGIEGEICIRPATTGPWANCWTGTLGYLYEPERTDALWRNGLLHTGDRGSLDADGALCVTGRLNDMIIRGGKNLDPTAIANAARDLDSVHDAVAIGLADDRLGQTVGLAVVAAPNTGDGLSELGTNEVMARLQDRGFRIDAIRIVDELPRNAMGKVDKLALAQLF